ncbi:protein involved in ribonucleotide reduction [Serratia fonticola]|uniref:Protein NrdI n=1 Tax=Serratia fonticola TaxID=47917 RepID=A0A559T7S9_SERFO|nr:protein involved in ribonucleotide reduction [Serratia fonticola]TQI96133.1 protein involved in ribonucleotide reduction [Serratia fonticola]TVZ70630.1 protein involved in ribonucleotide reduction [Serratia fonticola]
MCAMDPLVYFSSSSENTHRFVEKLALPAIRIPIAGSKKVLMEHPYILIVPSYGGGSSVGAVPIQVIRFLNDPQNRAYLRGVIAAGNTNFGAAYGIAGDIIAKKCQVPVLYRFELLGTTQDVANVQQGVTAFWQRQN